MKKRTRIFALLKKISVMDDVPKVCIKGSLTGATLYEGSVFEVPFDRCSDYVLRSETCGDVVVITSTFSPY